MERNGELAGQPIKKADETLLSISLMRRGDDEWCPIMLMECDWARIQSSCWIPGITQRAGAVLLLV